MGVFSLVVVEVKLEELSGDTYTDVELLGSVEKTIFGTW